MGDLVNLRQARKTKARGEKEKAAAVNRAKFGRTRAEREAGAQQAELETRRLELHRRQSDSED